jgi:hypothetical protein
MAKHDIYKLSETPAPNYDAWEFRTRISAKSKGLLKTILGADDEPVTGHSGKGWKAWQARQEAAAELLVKALDDDQLIHVRGLDSEPALMWERLRVVHEKTGVTGSAADLWSRYHTATYTDLEIPLRTHISTIRSYAEALDRLHNDKPSDTQTISRIFTSLPSSYSTIIKILKLHENAADIDFIVERILSEETAQKPTTIISPADSVRALFVSCTSKTSIICENPVCKTAGRTGHLVDNCFWPGGGKEGQWLEWWNLSKSITPPKAMSASFGPAGPITEGTYWAL